MRYQSQYASALVSSGGLVAGGDLAQGYRSPGSSDEIAQRFGAPTSAGALQSGVVSGADRRRRPPPLRRAARPGAGR